MAIDFPNSPSVNDYFSVDGKAYIFNGVSWGAVFAPSASGVLIGPEGPIGATGAEGPAGMNGMDGADGADGAGYGFAPYEFMPSQTTYQPFSTYNPVGTGATMYGDPGAYKVGDIVRVTGNIDVDSDYTYSTFEPSVYLVGRITSIVPREGYNGSVSFDILSVTAPSPHNAYAFLPVYLNLGGTDGSNGAGYSFLPYPNSPSSQVVSAVLYNGDPTGTSYIIVGDPGAYRIGDRVKITGNFDTNYDAQYATFESSQYLIGRITAVTPRSGNSGDVTVIIESCNIVSPWNEYNFLPKYLSITAEDGGGGGGTPKIYVETLIPIFDSINETVNNFPTWTCPAGVTQVKVTLIGGGGAGGFASISVSSGYNNASTSNGYSAPASGGNTTMYDSNMSMVFSAQGGSVGFDDQKANDAFTIAGAWGVLGFAGASVSAGVMGSYSSSDYGSGGAQSFAEGFGDVMFDDGGDNIITMVNRVYAKSGRGIDGSRVVSQQTVVPETMYTFEIGLGGGYNPAVNWYMEPGQGKYGAAIIEYVL